MILASPPEPDVRFSCVRALLSVLLLAWAPFCNAVVVQGPPPKVFRVAGRVVAPSNDGALLPIPATLALVAYSDSGLVTPPLHVVTADEAGSFSFPAVPRGRYRLRVSLSGFYTFTAQIRVVRYSLRPRSTLLVTLYPAQVGLNPSTIATERPSTSRKVH